MVEVIKKKSIIQKILEITRYLNRIIQEIDFSLLLSSGLLKVLEAAIFIFMMVGAITEIPSIILSIYNWKKEKNFGTFIDLIANSLKGLGIIIIFSSFLAFALSHGSVASVGIIGPWIAALAAATPVVVPLILLSFAAYHLILFTYKFLLMFSLDKGEQWKFFKQECALHLLIALSLISATATIVMTLGVLALPVSLLILVLISLAFSVIGIGFLVKEAWHSYRNKKNPDHYDLKEMCERVHELLIEKGNQQVQQNNEDDQNVTDKVALLSTKKDSPNAEQNQPNKTNFKVNSVGPFKYFERYVFKERIEKLKPYIKYYEVLTTLPEKGNQQTQDQFNFTTKLKELFPEYNNSFNHFLLKESRVALKRHLIAEAQQIKMDLETVIHGKIQRITSDETTGLSYVNKTRGKKKAALQISKNILTENKTLQGDFATHRALKQAPRNSEATKKPKHKQPSSLTSNFAQTPKKETPAQSLEKDIHQKENKDIKQSFFRKVSETGELIDASLALDEVGNYIGDLIKPQTP